MAADEAAFRRKRRADPRLRGADVGDRAALGARLEGRCNRLYQSRDGRRDDDEIGLRNGLGEALRGGDCTALRRERQRVGIRVEAGNDLHSGPPRGEPDRGADQSGPDDCEAWG